MNELHSFKVQLSVPGMCYWKDSSFQRNGRLDSVSCHMKNHYLRFLLVMVGEK